jgi:hypothetical protein
MLKPLLVGITASITTTAYAQAETFSPLPKTLDCTMKVFGTYDVTDRSGANLDDIQDANAFITELGSGSYLILLREDGSTTYVGNIEGGRELELGREKVVFHRDNQNLFWFFESIANGESREPPIVTTGRITCLE